MSFRTRPVDDRTISTVILFRPSTAFVFINPRFFIVLSASLPPPRHFHSHATHLAGTDRHPDVRAHCFRRLVHDADNQRTQTAVSHRAGLHPVGVRRIHPVRVSKEEVGHCRYVSFLCSARPGVRFRIFTEQFGRWGEDGEGHHYGASVFTYLSGRRE